MSQEKTNKSYQKLLMPSRNWDRLKLAAPALVLAIGAVACGAESGGSSKAENRDVVDSASACAISEIGDGKTGWTHGAAKSAIEEAQEKAVDKIRSNNASVDASDVPTFSNADKAVEMADKGEVPDVGDQIEVCVEVSADSDGDVSTEVTSAEIIDLPNNN